MSLTRTVEVITLLPHPIGPSSLPTFGGNMGSLSVEIRDEGSVTRRIIGLLVAVALLAVGAACAGGSKTTSKTSDAVAAEATVTAARGGTIRLAGAELVVPPGAVDRDGGLTAQTTGAPFNLIAAGQSVLGPPVRPAGPFIFFDLLGAHLLHPARLTIPVDPAAFPASLGPQRGPT